MTSSRHVTSWHCHHKILINITCPVGSQQNILHITLQISQHNQTACIIICEATLQTFEMVQESGVINNRNQIYLNFLAVK